MNSTTSIGAPAYHVQSTAQQSHADFPTFSYHGSVSALWNQKWRPPCAMGVYPFTDGDVSDFDPVFAELVRVSGDDPAILFAPDEYAKPFLVAGKDLVDQAARAEAQGQADRVRDLYLRAAAVYRIGRFPINRSPLSQEAWEQGKQAYLKAGALLDPPTVAVEIRFTAVDEAAGDTNAVIQAYLRTPTGPPPKDGWPVLLFVCGLDAYRTDHTPRTQQHVDRGFATLSFEIPGTGDCPAAPNDPVAADRLMTSVLDWVADHAEERSFDTARILARGISTGGYYAMRVAHTHPDRLFAVVAQGGGCHHMFDPAWIEAQNQMEYPFALADALAYKFGYRQPEGSAVDLYAAQGRKFSLLDAGILDQPSCRLLLINGMEDSIFPIEDNLLVAVRGDHKDLVVRGDRGHMGNPGAEDILYAWIDDVVAGRP